MYSIHCKLCQRFYHVPLATLGIDDCIEHGTVVPYFYAVGSLSFMMFLNPKYNQHTFWIWHRLKFSNMTNSGYREGAMISSLYGRF